MSTAPPAPTNVASNGAQPSTAPRQASSSVQARSQKKEFAVSQNAPAKNLPQKKIPRRSSKPIINWFQRKLAGSSKVKRVENVPPSVVELGLGRNASNSNRQMGRVTSSPLPIPNPMPNSRTQTKFEPASLPRRKTRSISLNGEESLREFSQSYPDDDASIDQSLLTRDSIWSPASALEADDDASVRPIPPSAPPSPSPSRSSSSYLSDPRTFRSIAASTKPTTLLSIDLNGGGMAHIAQAPATAPSQIHRISPHVRHSSSLSSSGVLGTAGSITFSTLPSAQASGASTLRNPGSLASLHTSTQQTSAHDDDPFSTVQAPLHTAHHPRNNPRPSSPPLDNASMLTLASSAFAHPNRLVAQNYPSSALGDTVSQYGGGSLLFPDAESTSHFLLGEDERLDERDFDASVRALRPRSSRRNSWESEASRWSARLQGVGTPSLVRERSVWTTNSVRTGGFSIENGEIYETADDELGDELSTELDKSDSLLDTPLENIGSSHDQDREESKQSIDAAQAQDSTKDAVYPPEAKQARSSSDTVAHGPRSNPLDPPVEQPKNLASSPPQVSFADH